MRKPEELNPTNHLRVKHINRSGYIPYRQCYLKRGNWVQASWIPEQFATLNASLTLKGESGWTITRIYGRSMRPARGRNNTILDQDPEAWGGF